VISQSIAAVVIAAALTLSSHGAVAAAPGIEVSPDGSAYGASLSTAVFSSAPVLVPGQEATARFFVRNSTGTAAWLQLALANPRWTSAAYAAALSVTAGVPGMSGRSIRLDTGDDCSVFISGVRLESGQSIAVTTKLALGDLTGSTGQDAAAGLDFAVTLVEAVGSAPAPSCVAPTNTSSPPGSTTVVTVLPTEVLPTEAIPPIDVPEATPGPEAPPVASDVRANTEVGFDGTLVTWAFAALMLGAAIFLLLAYRRRRSHEDS
jgi:cell division septation protein DedD